MRLCCVEGCGLAHSAKGYCNTHYLRMRSEEPGYRATKATRMREYMRNNPTQKERVKDYRRSKLRNFPMGLAARLRCLQQGRCAICQVPFSSKTHQATSEAADHDHTKRKPRGLLCTACNVSLGYYEKHQRQAGLYLAPYEHYLANPPTHLLEFL